MWRTSRTARFILWTIVLAVMTAKASGAHVHLCMDGEEPPASVHVADSHNDEHHQNEGQADKDVNPLLGTLAMKVGPDFDLGLVVPLSVLSWDLPVTQDRPCPTDPGIFPSDHPVNWRPPLRGPPA